MKLVKNNNKKVFKCMQKNEVLKNQSFILIPQFLKLKLENYYLSGIG